MRIHGRIVWKLSKISLMSVVSLFLGTGAAQARTHLSGTYKCVSVEIAGKAKRCSAPPLEMNSDGSYQILDEKGTYEVLRGRWLVLSSSRNHGWARLDGSKVIVFEFVSGGKRSKITYRRKYERPPGWVSG